MSTIVEQELEVRVISYNVNDPNTLLLKASSDGRVYYPVCIGSNLTVNLHADGKYYLDSSGAGTVVGVATLPEYANHDAAPTPAPGSRTIYAITGDDDFIYFKYADGSNHNRRLSLDWIDSE